MLLRSARPDAGRVRGLLEVRLHFGSQRVDVICKLLIRAGAIHAATRGCEGADLERAGVSRVAFALGSPIQAVQAMSPNREQVAQQLGPADHPAAAVLPPSELEHTAVRTWHASSLDRLGTTPSESLSSRGLWPT